MIPFADEPTRLPLKKRGYAEKTLPRLNNNDDSFFPEYKDMDLDELKINAYYDVLKAFMAESSTISSVSTTGLNLFHVFVVSVLDGCARVVFQQRIMIVKELKSELKIDHKTHTALQEGIKSDTLVQELRYLGLHARK